MGLGLLCETVNYVHVHIHTCVNLSMCMYEGNEDKRTFRSNGEGIEGRCPLKPVIQKQKR